MITVASALRGAILFGTKSSEKSGWRRRRTPIDVAIHGSGVSRGLLTVWHRRHVEYILRASLVRRRFHLARQPVRSPRFSKADRDEHADVLEYSRRADDSFWTAARSADGKRFFFLVFFIQSKLEWRHNSAQQIRRILLKSIAFMAASSADWVFPQQVALSRLSYLRYKLGIQCLSLLTLGVVPIVISSDFNFSKRFKLQWRRNKRVKIWNV